MKKIAYHGRHNIARVGSIVMIPVAIASAFDSSRVFLVRLRPDFDTRAAINHAGYQFFPNHPDKVLQKYRQSLKCRADLKVRPGFLFPAAIAGDKYLSLIGEL